MVALSLAHLTVLEVAPPALFALAAEAGYANVGIRTHPVAAGAICYPLTRANVIAWRRALADAGVGVHDVEFVTIAPDFDAGDLAAMLELAGELGARRLSVAGDDPNVARLAGNFGDLCDLAARSGLGVDLEFMRFRPLGTLPDALEVLRRAHRPNGRLLLDVLHLFRSGGTAAQVAQVQPELLGSLQLCDAPLQAPTDAGLIDEARTGRLFSGEGGLPLLDFLQALPAGIPIGLEVPAARTHPELGHAERAKAACAAAQRLLSQRSPGR